MSIIIFLWGLTTLRKFKRRHLLDKYRTFQRRCPKWIIYARNPRPLASPDSFMTFHSLLILFFWVYIYVLAFHPLSADIGRAFTLNPDASYLDSLVLLCSPQPSRLSCSASHVCLPGNKSFPPKQSHHVLFFARTHSHSSPFPHHIIIYLIAYLLIASSLHGWNACVCAHLCVHACFLSLRVRSASQVFDVTFLKLSIFSTGVWFLASGWMLLHRWRRKKSWAVKNHHKTTKKKKEHTQKKGGGGWWGRYDLYLITIKDWQETLTFSNLNPQTHLTVR